MNQDMEAKAKLYRKIADARRELNMADWTPDKSYTVGSSIIKYVSADKIKRIISPILVNNGLDLELEYHDLRQEMELPKKPMHWSIVLDASLVDVDTGLASTSRVYGESSTTDDKGATMAQTTALRRFFMSKFLIVDGLDEIPQGEGGTYTKKTGVEAEEVRSRILENAVAKPPAPKPEPAMVQPQPAMPKAEAPAPKPATPKAEAPAPKPAKPAKPAPPVAPAAENKEPEGLVSISSLPESVPIVSRNFVARALKSWNSAYTAGEVSAERYAEMAEAYSEINDGMSASNFLHGFREVC